MEVNKDKTVEVNKDKPMEVNKEETMEVNKDKTTIKILYNKTCKQGKNVLRQNVIKNIIAI
jgi:hypothetical protein